MLPSNSVRHAVRDEVESFTTMQDRIRAENYQGCISAGVTPEYLDRLTTAFVADGTLGFNMFHAEYLFKAGVDPEYANQYLAVGNQCELEDIAVFYNAGVEPSLGILGLRKGLTRGAIVELHEKGIPGEYVDVMSFLAGPGLALALKAC